MWGKRCITDEFAAPFDAVLLIVESFGCVIDSARRSQALGDFF